MRRPSGLIVPGGDDVLELPCRSCGEFFPIQRSRAAHARWCSPACSGAPSMFVPSTGPQQKVGSTAAASGSITLTVTPTKIGSLIVVYVINWFANAAPTVTGPGSVAALSIVGGGVSSGGQVIWAGIFVFVATSTSSQSVTIAYTGAGTSMRAGLEEWYGLPAPSAWTNPNQFITGASGGATGGSTSTNTGNIAGTCGASYGGVCLALFGAAVATGTTLTIGGTMNDGGWGQTRFCTGWYQANVPTSTGIHANLSWSNASAFSLTIPQLIPSQQGLLPALG